MTAPITMTSEVVTDEDRYTRLGDGEQRLFRFRIGATEIGTMLVSVPLRFIGYVVIHPEHRGRGYAHTVFELAAGALGGDLALERNPRPEALRVVDSLRRSSEWVVDDHPTIRVAYWTVPRVDYPADVGDPALRLRLRDTIGSRITNHSELPNGSVASGTVGAL